MFHDRILIPPLIPYNSDLQTFLNTDPYISRNNFHAPPILAYVFIHKYLFLFIHLQIIYTYIHKEPG
jgi:hypothetical protein